jgi:hypothetical protein
LGVLLNLKNQLATIFKMSNSGISTKGVIQIILVLGAIYLASIGAAGWGWMLFIFFLTAVL